ncbi:MAG: proline--tRNA ligase, partial [Candidatus Delongbacteria bacterium]|nr:proline--tRNA ligase [Candidatus Delongbacteria bacterium]
MAEFKKTAIPVTREEDYPQWYLEVIKAGELAENSDVRGCMVIKPWGYTIWENMQRELDQMFKDTGHVNAYFPLFIPLEYLQQEADHVEGFAKECAVVTHHRLSVNSEGKLVPDGKLEEPLVVRPTSETIIGASYAKWVNSYRDLPILINQWANVVRWEMRTRLFLRTAEFLWQEGHTVHATREEAMEETYKMLNVYKEFAEKVLALPVIEGEKSESERFPGAVSTYSIEAMMQDKKALQSGTSHFLGQNFAKASKIKFQSKEGKEEFAWTTSWGVSTRLIGALVMAHSDDNGLILPPRIAPAHIVLLPIYKDENEKQAVTEYIDGIKKEISELRLFDRKIVIHVDDRDIRGGEKNWYWIKKGV